jgi:hypothetical protein
MSHFSSQVGTEDSWIRVRLIFAVEATNLYYKTLDPVPSLVDTDLLP